MKYLIYLLVMCSILYSYEMYFSNNKKVILQKINITSNSVSESNSSIAYYRNQNDIVLGVTDTLLIKLEEDNYLNKYIEDFNLTVLKNLGHNIYLLKTNDKELTLDISNKLYSKDDIIYAHPNFIKKSVLR